MTARIPRDSQTKTLVKNVATKQRREAINALSMHEEIKPEPYKKISKLVSLEFDDMDVYWRRVIRTNSLVSRTKLSWKRWEFSVPSGLTAFEVQVVYRRMLSKSALRDKLPCFSDSNASTLKKRQASAVHYRILTIMFHSGVQHDDLTRLNHLGVCVSPDWQLQLNRTNHELRWWANGVWQNNNDFGQA